MAVEISEFVWTEDRIAHIGRHGVEAEGVDVLGETEAGRHLFCVVISFPDGRGYPVTAREMTEREKQRYSRWKKP